MKRLILLSLCMVPVAASYALAARCDRMEVMRSCMREEGGKPDYTRSGVSAAQYCATLASMECPS